MRAGGDDANFFGVAILLVFMGAVATVGIGKMAHKMKNVTFSPATAVHTATAMPR